MSGWVWGKPLGPLGINVDAGWVRGMWSEACTVVNTWSQSPQTPASLRRTPCDHINLWSHHVVIVTSTCDHIDFYPVAQCRFSSWKCLQSKKHQKELADFDKQHKSPQTQGSMSLCTDWSHCASTRCLSDCPYGDQIYINSISLHLSPIRAASISVSLRVSPCLSLCLYLRFSISVSQPRRPSSSLASSSSLTSEPSGAASTTTSTTTT